MAVLTAAAFGIATLYPPALSPILVALALGLAVAHFGLLPPITEPGIRLASTTFLRLGVVLLGLRTTVTGLLEAGAPALAIALGGMVVVTAMAIAFGSRLVSSKAAWLLIAVGTAICGNSAVAAAAPVIGARERDVSMAVGIVTLFGTIALITYPVIGAIVGMDQTVFGTWAGTGINDTAQVVAAGEAYGPEAGAAAVTVKFVRNILILPTIAGLAIIARKGTHAATVGPTRLPWARAVPPFVLGFVAMAVVASLGVLPDGAGSAARHASGALIAAGMVALGARTRLADLRSLGPGPVLLGIMLSLTLAIFSFTAVSLVL